MKRNANLTRETIIENAADIMKKAHEITRKTRETYPTADYRTTLAAALRMLWNQYGKTAAEIWSEMTTEEQARMVNGYVWYDYNHDDARINRKTGKPAAPLYYWMDGKHPEEVRDGLAEVAQETWTILLETIPAADEETPLGTILSRAIHKAASRILRQHKNPRAIRTTVDEETGDERSVIDTKAGAEAARIESPETAAVIDDLIGRACKDETDRIVIADRIGGYKQSETAALLNIGQRAVSKRLDGIRDRLAETIGRDPREKKAPRGKHAPRA